MKITYIHEHFRTPEEGGGQRPFEFANRLLMRGHDVTVIRAAPREPLLQDYGFKSIQIRATYDNGFSMSRRLLSFSVFALQATLRASATPADLVFASSTPLTTAVPAIAAKICQHVPMVFEVRDLWPEVPIKLGLLTNPTLIRIARTLEAAAYRHASAVVALSPAMAAGVLRVAPDQRVEMIPNTSHIAKFRKPKEYSRTARESLGLDPNALTLVYAGSLGISYDPEWLIDLQAACPNIAIYIIGEGAMFDSLREHARQLGLSPDTILPGAVDHNTVIQFYNAADIVVSSLIANEALYDNSLNKVFDAFAAGRPVMFNHPGWLAERAANSGAGWIVSSENISGIAEFLGTLSQLDLDSAARRSADLADDEFSTNSLTDRFISVLESAGT